MSLNGCKPLGKPGTPAFPGKVIRVALPKNTKAISTTENITRNSSLTRNLQLVECNQETQFIYLDENNEPVSSELPFYKPDQKIYEELLKSPKPIVKLLTTEWVDDIPMAVLEVVPVRYIKNGTIELAEIIEVTIKWKPLNDKILYP